MEVKEVSCGKAHTVAVLTQGHLYSWGAGACGQLGHPDTSSFPADEDGYPYQPIPRCVTVSSKPNDFCLILTYISGPKTFEIDPCILR